MNTQQINCFLNEIHTVYFKYNYFGNLREQYCAPDT